MDKVRAKQIAKDWRVWGGAIALVGGIAAAWKGAENRAVKTTGIVAALLGVAALVWRGVSGEWKKAESKPDAKPNPDAKPGPETKPEPERAIALVDHRPANLDDLKAIIAKAGKVTIGHRGFVCQGTLEGLEAAQFAVLGPDGKPLPKAEQEKVLRAHEIMGGDGHPEFLKVTWGPKAKEDEGYRLQIGGVSADVVCPRFGTLGAQRELDAIKLLLSEEVGDSVTTLESKSADSASRRKACDALIFALIRVTDTARWVVNGFPGTLSRDVHPSSTAAIGQFPDLAREMRQSRRDDEAALLKMYREFMALDTGRPALPLSPEAAKAEIARCQEFVRDLAKLEHWRDAQGVGARFGTGSTLEQICYDVYDQADYNSMSLGGLTAIAESRIRFLNQPAT